MTTVKTSLDALPATKVPVTPRASMPASDVQAALEYFFGAFEIGTTVQAWSVRLDEIAALSAADGTIIVGDGTHWVAESGDTARASLGLTIGVDVPAWTAYLEAWGTVNPAIYYTASQTDTAISIAISAIGTVVVLKGSWDASSGSFPGGGAALAGWSYIVSGAGTVDGVDFGVNDRVVAIVDNASTAAYASNWLKLDYTDEVLSVAGRTGAVVLSSADITDATATGLALLTSANASAARSSLGLVIGTDVQAYDADLAAIAGLTTDAAGRSVLVLTDPDADRLLFWDDSAGTMAHATPANGIEISGTSVQMSTNQRTGCITYVMDGGGSVLTTGVKGDFRVPANCTITGVTAMADQSGSVVVDIWKDTLANYPPTVTDTITASAPVTISSATYSEDTTLTGWTTSLSQGDTLRFNINSVSTITRVVIELRVSKS